MTSAFPTAKAEHFSGGGERRLVASEDVRVTFLDRLGAGRRRRDQLAADVAWAREALARQRSFPSYDNLAKFHTSSLADNPSGGQPAFVGDFSELLFAIHTDFHAEVSRLDTDSLNKLQVAIRIYGRFDAAAMAPGAFEVIDNLKASCALRLSL